MNAARGIFCFLAAGFAVSGAANEGFDRLDEALTWTANHDRVRLHLSGTLDLEGYTFQDPAPALVHADSDTLFNPRLTLFLDAQLGAKLYGFVQARADHGFDPSAGAAEWRLDEYALRFTPRADGLVNFQVGKFGTVVGNWVARHHSWDNPFISAPLPYENLTGIFDTAAANSPGLLFLWSHVRPTIAGSEGYFERERVPVIWGPSYATGAAVTGVIGRADYAFEVKNASLSSRPYSWDAGHTQWRHPTFSGRLGYRPDASWYFGLSASTGTYLNPEAGATLVPGRTLDDYREIVWAQDVGYAWHHVQLWAEAYEAAFEIPRVGRAMTIAYYVEAKYKFTPQFSGAVRWNQQFYGDILDAAGQPVQWGRNVWRIDLAPNYRFTAQTEFKLQYSLQAGSIGPRDRTRLLAAQFILRF
ncbi:MAG: hypothetical protein JWQ83_93 [Lacunisphaera sp.]|nr:hypothetical protein [Lacunisphaera sp.]